MSGMNFEVKDLPAKLGPLVKRLKQYVVFIFIIAFLGVFGFLVFQINTLTNVEPSDDDVLEGLQTVRRPRVDEEIITKLEQLEDANVEVQTLFENARNNPFSEQ